MKRKVSKESLEYNYMRHDQSPHPLIEDHYHIKELIDAQEIRSTDRTEHRNRQKERAERDELITEAKIFDTKDFWCDTCNVDFVAQAVKQIEEDWNADQRISFYKTKCWKGHWCIRLVTDKYKDGFYYKSRFMALDRGNHFADTVQPFETGFNMLYGKHI